jgi:hypothetical protein
LIVARRRLRSALIAFDERAPTILLSYFFFFVHAWSQRSCLGEGVILMADEIRDGRSNQSLQAETGSSGAVR